ncbi:MAG TPA: hypothetical protein DHU26_06635 [Spirochaetaceae bacterium]|nr:hypothetical protein [Spirochaetaceae bacterium]
MGSRTEFGQNLARTPRWLGAPSSARFILRGSRFPFFMRAKTWKRQLALYPMLCLGIFQRIEDSVKKNLA